MAQFDQVFGHGLGGRAIVQADGRMTAALNHLAGVDDGRQLDVGEGRLERIEGTQLDHTVSLMVVHQLGEFPFDLFAALGVAQQQPIVGRLRRLLRAADDPGKKSVGDGGHQDHQVAGAPRAKLHRHQIRPVAGLFHGRVDLVPCLGKHTLRRFQGSGHRGHRDAGQPGYFTDIGQDHLVIEPRGRRA
ncbi:hypothetical protein D3C73_947730 [compost metagenome]